MTERIDFIAELLRESELADKESKIDMDRLRADQLLAAVAVLVAVFAGVPAADRTEPEPSPPVCNTLEDLYGEPMGAVFRCRTGGPWPKCR